MKKQMKITVWAACCLALFALSCNPSQQSATDTRAADEAAIRQEELDWSKVTEAGDLNDSTGYYSFLLDDAVFLPPNEPALNGKEAIRKMVDGMFAMPGFAVKWQPTTAEASSSGDLGYAIGTYELTVNDAAGKPMTERGKYLNIWKKQSDGKWKVAAEAFNSDMPLSPPTAQQ